MRWLLLLAALGKYAAELGYVEPATCRPCHARIFESYRKTGMGRSFAKVETTPTLPEFFHERSGRYYSWWTDQERSTCGVSRRAAPMLSRSGWTTSSARGTTRKPFSTAIPEAG